MLNQIQLIGRVGADPENHTFQNGDSVANFSLATSIRFKDKNSNEYVEKTEWHRIKAFVLLSKFVSTYVEKGQLIYVQGYLSYRKYVDKDQIERTSTEIVADRIRLLSNKTKTSDPNEKSGFDDIDSNIPF
jgi:single-strand DNA-binding protein